tara:strand:- start:4248 stop:4448 length:201 start_codon:yes stop_codon:yes gene_type:complete
MDEFYISDKVLRLIRERLEELQLSMMAGNFISLEDYRSAVGEVRGLTFIEGYVIKLREKSGESDND